MGEEKKAKYWHRVDRNIYRRAGSPNLYLVYYRRGKRYQENVDSDKIRDARRLLKYREGEIAQGKIPALRAELIRFDELAKDFLDDYRANNKKSLWRAEISIKHLSRHFDGIRAVDISTDRIKSYIAERRKLGISVATVNRELAALKRMLNLGAQATPPKVMRVPHIKSLSENNTRTGFMEKEDFEALRDALPHYLKPLITVAYWTGMRAGELKSLRWDDIDLRERCITLNPGTTKSGQGRVIYMPEELWLTLRQQKDERDLEFQDCPWVFHREGKSIRDCSRAWKSACKRVGLKGVLFHDLRRTGVRNLVRAGVPERVAMTISGHKTRSIFDRYNIVSNEDLKEAARKQEAHYRSNTVAISTE